MSVRDQITVLCGDPLARLEKAAVDRLSAAVKSRRAVEHAPALTRDKADQAVLDAEALCSEFGALGSEC